jgi:hypothetical protein
MSPSALSSDLRSISSTVESLGRRVTDAAESLSASDAELQQVLFEVERNLRSAVRSLQRAVDLLR